MGPATFVRGIQNGIENFIYAVAISQIRKWYLDLHPDAPSLFLLSTDGTPSGAMRGIRNPRWQALFTTAAVVAFVISILTRVTVVILFSAALGLHIFASAAIGACGSFVDRGDSLHASQIEVASSQAP